MISERSLQQIRAFFNKNNESTVNMNIVWLESEMILTVSGDSKNKNLGCS